MIRFPHLNCIFNTSLSKHIPLISPHLVAAVYPMQGENNPPTDAQYAQAKEYLRLQAANDAALTEEYKALQVPKACSKVGRCQLGGKSCGCGRKLAASVRVHQLM